MPKIDPIKRLADVPLFEGLAKSELRTLARESSEKIYAAGTVVIEEGQKGGRFFLVLGGRAKVLTKGRTRRHLAPGDFFGEMSLIDGSPRSATVVAETDLTLLTIASWNFMAILQESWPMTRKVMADLCRRIRSLDRSAT